MVIVRVDWPPWAIAVGLKALDTAAELTDATFAAPAVVLLTGPFGPVPVTLATGIWLLKFRPVAALAGSRAWNTMVQTPGLAPTPATIVPPVQDRVLAPSTPLQVPPVHPVLLIGLLPLSTI